VVFFPAAIVGTTSNTVGALGAHVLGWVIHAATITVSGAIPTACGLLAFTLAASVSSVSILGRRSGLEATLGIGGDVEVSEEVR
jgi:hypothetical protein